MGFTMWIWDVVFIPEKAHPYSQSKAQWLYKTSERISSRCPQAIVTKYFKRRQRRLNKLHQRKEITKHDPYSAELSSITSCTFNLKNISFEIAQWVTQIWRRATIWYKCWQEHTQKPRRRRGKGLYKICLNIGCQNIVDWIYHKIRRCLENFLAPLTQSTHLPAAHTQINIRPLFVFFSHLASWTKSCSVCSLYKLAALSLVLELWSLQRQDTEILLYWQHIEVY